MSFFTVQLMVDFKSNFAHKYRKTLRFALEAASPAEILINNRYFNKNNLMLRYQDIWHMSSVPFF